jgi:hypothetical protein
VARNAGYVAAAMCSPVSTFDNSKSAEKDRQTRRQDQGHADDDEDQGQLFHIREAIRGNSRSFLSWSRLRACRRIER